MAVSSRYTVIIDACVLYSRLHRDVMLSLAHADLYTARWTRQIEGEWKSALLRQRPGTEANIERAIEQMHIAIPDCLVVDHEPLIPGLHLPDPNDRHVLAAAIKAMRARWERPHMTALAMVDLFEARQLPQTAAHLRDVLDLI
jgi:hypothetical protein